MALREWYRQARVRFMRDDFDRTVLDGGIQNLEAILSERISRLGAVAEKMGDSSARLAASGGDAAEIAAQRRFGAEWPQIQSRLTALSFEAEPPLVETFRRLRGADYIAAVRSLAPTERDAIRVWLQSIVDAASAMF
jgi:hypothetical protein